MRGDLGQGGGRSGEPFNLMVPRSRCQQCGHQIRWYENIPVLSYLFLRGKCSSCSTPISLRYPLVELATGGAVLLVRLALGRNADGPGLVRLLGAPSSRWRLSTGTPRCCPTTSRCRCCGPGCSSPRCSWTDVPLASAVWGAAAGYLSLWLVYWVFKLVTGKEGMGYGDFKLFAALGAWFGWQALVPIILMASVIGAVVGIALKFSSGLREGGYVPFGPFLAGAGLTAMVFGPQVDPATSSGL